MTNKQPIRSFSLWGDDNPEKVKSAAVKTVGFKQQLKGLANPESFLSQMFGGRAKEAPSAPKRETLRPAKRETLVFSYETKREEKLVRQETQLILQKLKEQVTLLEKSEKALVSEASKIKLEKLPPKTGIYYLRFLEWLLISLKQLRIKVDEGKAWLSTFNQRQKKKMGYWKMYKKHGTTFGLSHERNMATQTG